MAKRKRKPKTAHDARKIRVETVEGGYGQGIDKTERVIAMDTVTAMHRRGQITLRQYEAAETYRRAFEFAPSVPSSMDDSKVGGSVPGSRSPSAGGMWAASLLNQASSILGFIDGAVVRMIAGEGFSINQTARRMNDEARVIGSRLRRSLDVLANAWQGPEIKSRPRAFAVKGAMPTEFGGNVERDPSQHAHAYKDKGTGNIIVVSKDGRAVVKG